MKTKLCAKSCAAICLAALLVLALVVCAAVLVPSKARAEAGSEEFYRLSYITQIEEQADYGVLGQTAMQSVQNGLELYSGTVLGRLALQAGFEPDYEALAGSIVLPTAFADAVNTLSAELQTSANLGNYTVTEGEDMLEELSGKLLNAYTRLNSQRESAQTAFADARQLLAGLIAASPNESRFENFVNSAFGKVNSENVGYFGWKNALFQAAGNLFKATQEEQFAEAASQLHKLAVLNSVLADYAAPQLGDKSVQDILFDLYLQHTQGSAELQKGVSYCLDFVRELYNTYIFADACRSLCEVYALNQLRNNGSHPIEGVTEQTVENFASSQADAQRIFGEHIATFAVRVLGLDQIYFVNSSNITRRVVRSQLTDESSHIGTDYQGKHLSVNDNVITGATIYLPTLPEYVSYMLPGGCSFATSAADKATVDDNGVATVVGTSGEFDISMKWGDAVVYTQHFEITSHPFDGEGTLFSPYVISNAEQLRTLCDNDNRYLWADTYHFVLSNDITFSSNAPQCMEEFHGVFDGNGHSVAGLTNPLFNHNAGTVKHLIVTGARLATPTQSTINHEWLLGGICNKNTGTLLDCHLLNSTIDVTTTINKDKIDKGENVSQVGGLVGNTSVGEVRDCSVCNCTITSIVTNTYRTELQNKNTIVNIIGYAGAIAGYTSSNIVNCISAHNKVNLTLKPQSWYHAEPWQLLENCFGEKNGYFRCHGVSYLGGFAGQSENCTFADCTMMGTDCRYEFEPHTEDETFDHVVEKKGGEREQYNNNYEFIGHNPNTSIVNRHSTVEEAAALGWTFLNGNATLTWPTVEVAHLPYQTVYTVGEDFNAAGLLLRTSDGRLVTCTAVEGFDSSAANANERITVTAKYGEAKTTFALYISCPHSSSTVQTTERVFDDQGRRGTKYVVVCPDCSKQLACLFVPDAPTPHEWDSGRVSQEATCTTPGERVFTCVADHQCDLPNRQRTEEIAPTGHSIVPNGETEATCTEAGHRDYKCLNCTYTYSEAIPALGHSYDEKERVDASCTDDGQITYSCSRCAEEYTDTLAKLGHDYKVERKAPTCTEPGSETTTCNRCNDTSTKQIDATGHNLQEYEATEPTCTENGNERMWVCSNCNGHFRDGDAQQEFDGDSWLKPATGHELTPFEAVDPTCTEPGRLASWYCYRCQTAFADADAEQETNIEKVTLKPLGHDMEEHPAKAATYTEDGNMLYFFCKRCEKYFDDAVGSKEYTDPSKLTIAKLGIVQKFKDEVAALDGSFENICTALATYAELSEAERSEVSEQFAALQQAADAYNNRIGKMNEAYAAACTTIRFGFGSTVAGLIALAAVALTLKRRFF